MSLRTASSRKLAAVGAIATIAVAGGVAMASAGGSGPVPPAKPLATAVHDALAASHPAGITARIQFTDNVVPGGALAIDSPLLSGASGRVWAGDGKVRLELQTSAGDTEIGIANGAVTVYDAASNTVYHATLPTHSHPAADATPGNGHATPTIAQITAAIDRLTQQADVSGALPVDVAGQPAYQVRLSPKHDGGLLGAAELAWDASNGVPLRAAIYASGSNSPVLELSATEISFGPVAASDLAVNVPAGAKSVELTAPAHADSGTAGAAHQAPVEGLAAVQAVVPFTVAAPPTLLDLPLQTVRLVRAGNAPGAVAVYGKGLGAIVVYERAATASAPGANTHNPLASLPQVSIGGATGHELATALGTAIVVDRGGVSYLIGGSVPAAAAEAAARGLLS